MADDLQSQSLHAAKIERLMQAGQIAEAKRTAAELLRSGAKETDFLEIVANLLAPLAPRRRGRPPGSPVWQSWGEIGIAFERLRHEGARYEDAIEMLVSRYGRSGRVIEEIVREYRIQIGVAREVMREWQEEFDTWPAEEKRRYYAELNDLRASILPEDNGDKDS